MIVELTVENLAIIERAHITLGPGFTVLTGETGAGKSLLVDALELALGERADAELVRAGAPRASVNVVLDLSDATVAREKCTELGFAIEDNLLYIQREVFAEGRSQCRVGGKMVPVSALKQLGQHLVDLHGQHDHQSLLDGSHHIDYLDSWIGSPAFELLVQVLEKHEAAEQARRKLQSLRAGMRDREHRLDLLRFQINEIEATDPRPGEMAELEAQISRLKYAERLSTASFGALESISDREGCATDLLGAAVKSLDDALKYDTTLEAVVAPFREALYQIEEGLHGLREYAENLDADPGRLEEVAGRIDALKRLRRKYGEDESAIVEFLDNARSELATLEDSEASEDSLRAAVSRAEEELSEVAGRLSELRQSRAAEFSALVQNQLRDLAMDRALFHVDFKTKPTDPTGADLIEFFFSANAGEPPRPLSKIASGGEISRVMLAIKTALAGRAGVPTLIFDEVDTGLGGRAAATVARKLEELATHYQIVVISHLPQLASRASIHYRIEKTETNGRVVTQVRL
ncbi:MAG: DNA repair protein RecN, partial [Fimbriimonas sp.]|nr:DNA repair protein RecN [Fimbriimonas sp.]